MSNSSPEWTSQRLIPREWIFLFVGILCLKLAISAAQEDSDLPDRDAWAFFLLFILFFFLAIYKYLYRALGGVVASGGRYLAVNILYNGLVRPVVCQTLWYTTVVTAVVLRWGFLKAHGMVRKVYRPVQATKPSRPSCGPPSPGNLHRSALIETTTTTATVTGATALTPSTPSQASLDIARRRRFKAGHRTAPPVDLPISAPTLSLGTTATTWLLARSKARANKQRLRTVEPALGRSSVPRLTESPKQDCSPEVVAPARILTSEAGALQVSVTLKEPLAEGRVELAIPDVSPLNSTVESDTGALDQAAVSAVAAVNCEGGAFAQENQEAGRPVDTVPGATPQPPTSSDSSAISEGEASLPDVHSMDRPLKSEEGAVAQVIDVEIVGASTEDVLVELPAFGQRMTTDVEEAGSAIECAVQDPKGHEDLSEIDYEDLFGDDDDNDDASMGEPEVMESIVGEGLDGDESMLDIIPDALPDVDMSDVSVSVALVGLGEVNICEDHEEEMSDAFPETAMVEHAASSSLQQLPAEKLVPAQALTNQKALPSGVATVEHPVSSSLQKLSGENTTPAEAAGSENAQLSDDGSEEEEDEEEEEEEEDPEAAAIRYEALIHTHLGAIHRALKAAKDRTSVPSAVQDLLRVLGEANAAHIFPINALELPSDESHAGVTSILDNIRASSLPPIRKAVETCSSKDLKLAIRSLDRALGVELLLHYYFARASKYGSLAELWSISDRLNRDLAWRLRQISGAAANLAKHLDPIFPPGTTTAPSAVTLASLCLPTLLRNCDRIGFRPIAAILGERTLRGPVAPAIADAFFDPLYLQHPLAVEGRVQEALFGVLGRYEILLETVKNYSMGSPAVNKSVGEIITEFQNRMAMIKALYPQLFPVVEKIKIARKCDDGVDDVEEPRDGQGQPSKQRRLAVPRRRL